MATEAHGNAQASKNVSKPAWPLKRPSVADQEVLKRQIPPSA
jgi:hypothetical protein